MMRRVLRLAREHRVWAAVVVVALCLLGGLRVGDAQARGAAASPHNIERLIRQERADVAVSRLEADSASRSVYNARQLTARAALTAYLAGYARAHQLLPAGMRFACKDRAAGQCVVVEQTDRRTTRLVWPQNRPTWGRAIGLPPGALDGGSYGGWPAP